MNLCFVKGRLTEGDDMGPTQLRGEGGGSRSKSQIFLVRTYYDIWNVRNLNLFTESKYLRRRPRYDATKLAPTRAISGFCMENSPKKLTF